MLGWIRRLRRRGEPTPGQQAAEAALDRARVARQEAEERRPLVIAEVQRMRRLREENNFEAKIRAVFGGSS
ncbi:DUF7620 family protein [Streptomyces sp. NEAU-Y11]|uniref:DUF7620 family protein n=1 Tax=Streptomyces cucumeris TaxID=2962890 RepID=UPI0020C8B41B|nr:hypothetical protein [Streptomyces sp. NEAU-Y11]MCP9205487.1 hypothetical protein [Streptomyces sp. NEAU-Y11]